MGFPRLQQLVYLTDLETYLNTSRPMADLRWILTASGPTSPTLSRSCSGLLTDASELEGDATRPRDRGDASRKERRRLVVDASRLPRDLTPLDEQQTRAVDMVARIAFDAGDRQLRRIVGATTPMRFHRLVSDVAGFDVRLPLDWTSMTDPRLVGARRISRVATVEGSARFRLRQVEEFQPLVARALEHLRA